MHIPSERVSRELRSEDASLWYVPANNGEEIALLIKAPSSVIKALVAGCPLHLIFGKLENYLSVGVRIFDTPDAPVLISGPQKESEEHLALARLLREKSIPAFLFNELDVCLAWTNLQLTETDATLVADLLHSVADLYAGSFTKECSYALDCFCLSTDTSQPYPEARVIPLVEIGASLEPWRVNQVSFVGLREHHTITIDDRDEGEMFERAIWASLESVFPLALHKSPQVKIGDKSREFTDVLAFHEYGTFLIEAKDLSVIQSGYERDQDRRTKGVQKQVKKAIGQLVGACKALHRGDPVFDLAGKELKVVRNQPAHCIVLVTELMHSGDWDEIGKDITEAMLVTRGFFHLVDLREFITLLKASSGKANHFDYHLMERCARFAEYGSVHMRSQIALTRPN